MDVIRSMFQTNGYRCIGIRIEELKCRIKLKVGQLKKNKKK